MNKTVARSSSRAPEQVLNQVTVKLPGADLATLKGLASLHSVSVQEIVRRAIAKELARGPQVLSISIAETA